MEDNLGFNLPQAGELSESDFKRLAFRKTLQFSISIDTNTGGAVETYAISTNRKEWKIYNPKCTLFRSLHINEGIPPFPMISQNDDYLI